MKNTILLLLAISLSSIATYAATPTITSFSPGTGSVGTLVTISGTNLTSPTVFTIGGVSAIAVSNTGTILVAMVMPGAITGNVSITTVGGATSSSSNFTVTATPYPHLQQGAKLVDTGAVGQGRQGSSLGLSADGNTMMIGGYGDNGSIGTAWPNTRSGNIWTQQGSKLVGTGRVGSSYQGGSVALSADGNTAIVGGYGDSSVNGAAWVYIRTGGSTWVQQQNKLVGTGNVGAAHQGCSVAISADGNTAIVGGYSDNSQIGAAWVYTRTGGIWTQQGSKLVGSGSTGTAQQGYSVALSADGNTAMVGGLLDNGQIGAVWVFTRTGNTWTQQGSKLVGTGGVGASRQGISVALSANGNTALVGGNYDNSQIGAAWVYTRTGSTWTQQGNSLVGTGAAGTSAQGTSVALSADGNTAMVGAFRDSSYKGAAWVYTRSGSTWTQQGNKLVGTGGIGQGYQGISVALSADGNTGAIGGNYDNSLKGATWVFSSGNCTPSTTTFSHHICKGSSYTFGGQSHTLAGTYTVTLTNVGGCDSLVTLILLVDTALSNSFSHSICQGSSYTFGNNSLTSAGTYHDTLTSVGGCDSIIRTLILSVNTTLTNSYSHSICQGSSYTFGNNSLTSAGTYRDTLTSVGGCDSIIVTLILSVNTTLTGSFSHSICQGSSYTFGANDLSTAGTYYDTVTAGGGCDSIITLILTVNNLPTPPVITQTGSILSASNTTGLHLQWQLNGNNLAGDTIATITVSTNGTYSLLVTDPNGCSNTSNNIFVTNVGIEGMSFAGMSISLYPNPATASCTITIQNQISASYTVQFLDLDGRQINNPWWFRGNVFSFSLAPYAKGIYLVKLTDESGSSILKKLVVE